VLVLVSANRHRCPPPRVYVRSCACGLLFACVYAGSITPPSSLTLGCWALHLANSDRKGCRKGQGNTALALWPSLMRAVGRGGLALGVFHGIDLRLRVRRDSRDGSQLALPPLG
jgi:hypothetical protein